MSDDRTRPIGERVAATEEQIEILDRELIRVRSRLHDLEGDRATLRLLMEQLKATSRRVTEVSQSVETVATRAAEKTIALAFSDRAQIKEVREENRRERIKLWLLAGGFGIALGGFVMSLATGLIGGTP